MSEDQTEEHPAGASLERLVEQVRALKANADTDGESGNSDIVKAVLLSESYRGAFPHPDVLLRLNKVVENGAERAFSLTEREQQHRHECDKLLLESDIEERRREADDRRLVIILAFVFFFASLACAFIAVLTGHREGAALAGGTALATLVGGFFVMRSRRAIRDKKDKPD